MILDKKQGRSILINKVPEITISFWIIKILATTVGETAADLLAIRLDLGLSVTSVIISVLFILTLIIQIRSSRYNAPLYWVNIVLISIVGTLISDNLVDGWGVSLVTTSVAFSYILGVVFVLWFYSEGTLSIHTIYKGRRELFYWGAILFTFAMGTSVGDLLAENFELGYGQAVLIFATMIGLVTAAYYAFGLNAILCFWIAYILTRPLGASIGDLLAKPVIAGGFGWGTVTTSLIFFAAILTLVAYLTITKSDLIEPAKIE